MTTDIVGALDMLLAAMFIAASIYGLIAVIRSPRIDPEELERAKMRSCSWPTKDGDAFAATAPFQSKAEPTLVNGQVTPFPLPPSIPENQTSSGVTKWGG